MNLTKRIIELLTDYIEENKKLKEKFNIQRTNQTLYEEVLQYLNNDFQEATAYVPILLNTIYGNNIYVDEYYNLIRSKNEEEIRKFILKIEKEYNELKEKNIQLNKRIYRNFEKLSSAYRVRKCMEIKTIIRNSKNDITNVERIINYYEMAGVISNREEILLINEIESYNRNIAAKNSTRTEQEYSEHLYNEIPNIINAGYQEHDEVTVSNERKKTLDNFSKEIINTLQYIENEEIADHINSYLKYNLENKEFDYIIINVLNNYLEELTTLYTLILEKETYSQRTERIKIVKDYYEILDKYLVVRRYYEHIISYREIKEQKEVIEIEYPEEKILIYSRSEVNIEKAKIISDMSDITYEYYEDIYDLITKFKNGTLSSKKIKTIQKGSKSSGHIELKGDGVRIVLKRVRDNVYCVLGTFIKKANNDTTTYKKITDRLTPNVETYGQLEMQLELSKITEEELEKLVKEKSRKNGRK